MLYQALQPCCFDRNYLTGEFIPRQVILDDMVDKLIAWGKIRAIEEKAVAEEMENLVGQLKQWTKEQLRQEITRFTGKSIPKQYSKQQLIQRIQMILLAQVGDGNDEDLSI